MVPYPVSHSFDENRTLVSQNHFSSLLGGSVDGENVVSVDSQGWHAVGDSSDCDTVSCILVIDGSRDSIHVVSAVEQSLASQSGSEVQSWVEVTFGSCSLSKVSHCDFVFSIDSVLVACSRGLRQLSSKR